MLSNFGSPYPMTALGGATPYNFGLPFMNVEWPTGVEPFKMDDLTWNPFYVDGEMFDIAALPQDSYALPLIFMAEEHNGKAITELHKEAGTSIESLFSSTKNFDTTTLVDEGAHMVVQPVELDD
jgi:hypothetical protein